MSKLMEAEMDGAAAAKQVMALKDTIGKLKTVGGQPNHPVPGPGPERGQLHTVAGSLRSRHADFMTSSGQGRAHLTPRPPPLFSLLGPDLRG